MRTIVGVVGFFFGIFCFGLALTAPTRVTGIAAGALGVAVFVFGWRFTRNGKRDRPPAQPAADTEAPLILPPLATHQSHGRHYEGGGAVLADNINARVLIRYRNRDDVDSERTVKVTGVRGMYVQNAYLPETFFGFCELRQADRFFMFDRVAGAFDAESGEEITDLERYLIARGQPTGRKIEFSLLTPEEEAEVSNAEKWLATNGHKGTRHLMPPPQVTLEAHVGPEEVARFVLSIETVEQYGGRPFILIGRGKKIEKGARPKQIEFTLPGFHTPRVEVISLIPDGETSPVADIAQWLSQQGKRPKRIAASRTFATKPETGP